MPTLIHHLAGGGSAASPTDAELCQRWQTGDRASMGVLADRHRHYILGIVQSMAPFPGTVDYDDLIQAGMIGLLRAAKAYRPDRGTKFSTFAFMPIRWNILGELKRMPTGEELATDGEMQDPHHSGSDRDGFLSSIPAPEQVDDEEPSPLLSSLTDEQCELLGMAFGIGSELLSQRAIGERLGIGRSTIRKRLRAALAAVRAAAVKAGNQGGRAATLSRAG